MKTNKIQTHTMMRHRAISGAVATPSDHNNNESSDDDDDDAFAALSRKNKKTKNNKKRKDCSTSNRDDVTSNVTDVADNNTGNTFPSTAGNVSQQQQQKSTGTDSSASSTQISSTHKRHHIEGSDGRKANLDAILLELQEEAAVAGVSQQQNYPHRKQRRSNNSNDARYHRADDLNASSSLSTNDISETQQQQYRGSFVDPNDEHITTNVFVGNLAPSITEEQMTELFRQFGELYSVKIMWPRTYEERIRNRHTGFVCFMNRHDAEDAILACNDRDPFRVGRPLMLRWGKHVLPKKNSKQDSSGTNIESSVYHVSDVTIAATALPNTTNTAIQSSSFQNDIENRNVADTIRVDLHQQSRNYNKIGVQSIHVVIPEDATRANFISTVASFVAKDGGQLEQIIIQNERDSPQFSFVSFPVTSNEQYDVLRVEHIYYKWRVYSFCQGDGTHTWRTEPFVMVQDGCLWYPPPLDIDAAQREIEEIHRKEETIRTMKEQRRYKHSKRNIVAGRILERSKGSDGNNHSELSESELVEYDQLFIQQLCVSRESICQAMAYCFEKSHAAKQISQQMIPNLFTQHLRPGISIETISARLYLISDILYNTQQPGIRNAFLYRDALEKMSPELFTNLGNFVRTNFGRLSQERITTTISSIISVWTNWGVFDPTFLNELMSRFDGRTIDDKTKNNDGRETDQADVHDELDEHQPDETMIEMIDVDDNKPKGDWTSVPVDEEPTGTSSGKSIIHIRDQRDRKVVSIKGNTNISNKDPDGEPLGDDEVVRNGKLFQGDTLDPDGEPLDDDNQDDPDGEPLDDDNQDDPDGEPLDDDDNQDSPDGELLDDDNHDNPDGETLDDDDQDNPDGEPLDDDDNVDGVPLDDDNNDNPDGEPLFSNDIVVNLL